MIQIPHREAIERGWSAVEIEDGLSKKKVLKWLEEQGVKEYAFAGETRNRCVSIEDSSIAALFKLMFA